MNRGLVSDKNREFYDRLACTQLADEGLLSEVNSALKDYVSELQGSFEPVDEFSLRDLNEVYSYFENNRVYIKNASQLDQLFIEANQIISEHRKFLDEMSLVPQYLMNWNIKNAL